MLDAVPWVTGCIIWLFGQRVSVINTPFIRDNVRSHTNESKLARLCQFSFTSLLRRFAGRATGCSLCGQECKFGRFARARLHQTRISVELRWRIQCYRRPVVYSFKIHGWRDKMSLMLSTFMHFLIKYKLIRDCSCTGVEQTVSICVWSNNNSIMFTKVSGYLPRKLFYVNQFKIIVKRKS